MVENIKDEPPWAEDVFERLFIIAVDCDSSEMLEELLELPAGPPSKLPRWVSGRPGRPVEVPARWVALDLA